MGSIWRVDKEACEVCGATENLSRAHIICTKDDADKMGIEYRSNRNVLVLCGPRESYRSSDPPDTWKCHAMFDRKIMSFVHNSNDESMTKFFVIGGKHHSKEVTFKRKPHRRTLHSHFAHCLINKCFKGSVTVKTAGRSTNFQEVLKWVKEVTPKTSQASTPEKNRNDLKRSVDTIVTPIDSSTKIEEKRVDPSDPSAGEFTLVEFINFYGRQKGVATWKKAEEKRADPSDPSAGKFTLMEFINFYGQQEGVATWNKARKQRFRRGK